MIVYNWTSIKRRDKRLYSFQNTVISRSGISYGYIKIAAVCLFIFTIFGLIFCAATKTLWYNPITIAESSAAGYFYIVFVGAPLGLAGFLNGYKIQNYRAIDFIKIYFMPKTPVDQDNKKIRIKGNTINGFIEHL